MQGTALSAKRFLDSWTEDEIQVFVADQQEEGSPKERLVEGDDEVPDLERDLKDARGGAVEAGGEPGSRRRIDIEGAKKVAVEEEDCLLAPRLRNV